MAESKGAAPLPHRCARFYLCIAVPAMLLLCFLIPPFSGADEPAHFLRSVALAEGQLVPVINRNDPGANALGMSAGARLDRGVADFALQPGQLDPRDPARRYSLARMRADAALHQTGERVYARHSNTAIYPPLLYPVSTAVIAVAARLDWPLLAWLYAARIGNVLAGAALIAWSIRRGGDAAALLMVAGCLPITLFGLANVSTDALLLPLTLVFAVSLTRLAIRADLTRGDYAMLAASAVVIGAGKIAYMPMALLPAIAAWLIDRRATPRVRRLLAVFVVAVALWLAWSALIHDRVFTIRGDMQVADPRAQLSFILAHPLDGVQALATSMIYRIPALAGNVVGTALGWIDVRLPIAFGLLTIAILPAAAIASSAPADRVRGLLPIALGAAALCYFAVFLLIYLQNTPVGASSVEGVQGRYMFPLLLPLLCLTPRLRVGEQAMRRVMRGLMLYCPASAIVTGIAVVQRHW